MLSKKQLLTIGEMAQRSGHSVSKIRYYESIGLLQSIRSKGGNRLFLRADNRRLAFITIAQNFGYSLSEIQEFLAKLPQNRTPTRQDWEKISAKIQNDIDIKIEKLRIQRDKLTGCIGCGCLSLDRCALYNPDDKVSAEGPGPQLIPMD